MTEAELKGVAAQALNMALRALREETFTIFLASYLEGEVPPLRRPKNIEGFLTRKLGQDWLNSGPAKDAAFNVLRRAFGALPPSAVIIGTMTNFFAPGPKFESISEAERDTLQEGGHDKQWEAVDKEILSVCDAMSIVAQTPELVCMCVQKMDKETKGRDGQPTLNCMPQEGFGGRLKMFGDPDHKPITAHRKRRRP